jgi:hypothetical protein
MHLLAVAAGVDVASMLSDESRACLIGLILEDDVGIAGLNTSFCPPTSDAPVLGGPPTGFALAAPTPSPFQGTTSIRFSIAHRAPVSSGVYFVKPRAGGSSAAQKVVFRR